MRFLTRYLRMRRRPMMMALLFAAVFLTAFFLYRLPPEAVLYPAAVCTGLGAVYAVLDIKRVWTRHGELQRIHDFDAARDAAFDVSDDVEKEDLVRVIRALCDEHAAYECENERRYDGMMEYYTLWAHQIKTPIASMRLHLQNEDSALSRRLLSELVRVEQYVDMVLAFLRLESESTDYVIRLCPLQEMVRAAVRRFAGEFIARGLAVDCQVPALSVLTDEKWFVFVVEQVLSNALKYTREGGISLTCEAGPTLCVRDTGIGIAPCDLPRVFEKGYTGGNGRTDKTASGIGLYLVGRVCARLGHTISIESTPGEGTVVRIGLARPEMRHE